MKTWNLIIGAAVMAVITLNVNASEVLRSPRATANLDRPAASVAGSPNLATESRAFLGSPRALGNVTKAAVAKDDVNLDIADRADVASPRGAQTFPKAAAAGACTMACCAKK